MKQKLVLIISVVVGLFAAFLTRSYLAAKDKAYLAMTAEFERKHEKIEVVGIKRDLPSGTVLTMDDIGGVKIFKSAYQGHVIPAKDYMTLLGRKTVRALRAEAVIFWSDIEGGEPGGRGLSGDIKPRMRAISVNVSGAASVSGMVRPNDHVDVLGTFSFPSKEIAGEMELVTLTILQDVLVLATGRDTAKTQLFSDARGAAGSYSTVTLEVTPREAEMLVFAEQIKGRLALALRNPDDVYFEKTLPRVDFQMIQSELETLNAYRQQHLLRKRTN